MNSAKPELSAKSSIFRRKKTCSMKPDNWIIHCFVQSHTILKHAVIVNWEA